MAQESRAQAQIDGGESKESALGVQQGPQRFGDVFKHAAKRARVEDKDFIGPKD
jgi:hypothetical protein